MSAVTDSRMGDFDSLIILPSNEANVCIMAAQWVRKLGDKNLMSGLCVGPYNYLAESSILENQSRVAYNCLYTHLRVFIFNENEKQFQ